MIDLAQVQRYVQEQYNEADGSDRITDAGFAFHINTQPREYLDTQDSSKMMFGNGSTIIIKETGDIYSFPSSTSFQKFFRAKTLEEFNDLKNDKRARKEPAKEGSFDIFEPKNINDK